MTPAEAWPAALPAPWRSAPHRRRAREGTTLFMFDRLGSEHAAAASEVLRPVVRRCLPGYGDGPIPGRCFATATVSVLVLCSGRVEGFFSIEHVDLGFLRGSYITVAALHPALRGRGLLREVLRTEQPPGSAFVGTTTVVPSVYVILQRLSEEALGRDALVVPRLDGAALSDPFLRLGRTIVSAALSRAPETVDLEPQLVRRRFRQYDVQARPTPDFLASERPSEVVDLFRHRLRLGVGDAALVLAALDRSFLRWIKACEATPPRQRPGIALGPS